MQLHIKVKPNSKKDEVARDAEGKIMVRIKAPPVDGKANKYLTAFIADYFELPKSRVKLLKGEASQYKTLEIDAPDEFIQSRLNRA